MSIESSILWLIDYISGKQNSLSAKHTAYYLSTESIFCASLLVLALSITGVLTFLELMSVYITFIFFSIFTYVLLISRKQSDTPAVAEFKPSSIVFVILLSLIPSVFGYAVRDSILTVSIALSSLLIYVVILQHRNKRYFGVPEFFVNKYSDSQSEWIEASVALEKSMEYMKNGNRFRSYYWSLRAENSYMEAAKIDKLYLRDTAVEFATASSMISAAMMSDKNNRNIYKNEAYITLSRAIEKSRNHLCDNCGRQMHSGNIFKTDSNGDRVEYCGHCRVRSSRSTVTQSRGNRNKRTQKASRHSTSTHHDNRGEKYERGYPNENSDNRTKEEKKRHKRQDKWEKWQKTAHRNSKKNHQKGSKKDRDTKNGEEDKRNSEITMEESLDILNLSEDVESKREVTDAYRKRVKKVHPDVGGEAEDFKEAKKARDEVLEYIES